MSTICQAPAPADPRAPAASGPATPAAPTGESRVFDIDCQLSYDVQGTSDFIFMIHALQGMDQQVLSETIEITPDLPSRVHQDPTVHHRFLRMQAQSGGFTVHYRAQVRRTPQAPDLNAPEMAIADLPEDVLHNLMPTRYCESDILNRAACKIFGDLPKGYPRVQAICDWIYENIEYRLGSSTATTTAADVFLQRAGVCRDFAHMGVTFCRALNIPARLVVGYAKFDDPPPDFHAVFEAFLGGRWVLFDPTRMAPLDELVRIAVGRDAKDVAFATIYGPAQMTAMAPLIERAK
jgi:transglutaminase-like putative cysteine protease